MLGSGAHVVVALPVYQGRISPLFETAGRVLVAELANGVECNRDEIEFGAGGAESRFEAIVASGAELLVCGAISGASLWGLRRRGLVVWPSIVGDVEDVIRSLVSTGALGETFSMPGAALACRSRNWSYDRAGR